MDQIKFDSEDIENFELKNGRYGAYIQINNNNNISILQGLKNKLNKSNITKSICESLFKLKIIKEHTKQLINNRKTELE